MGEAPFEIRARQQDIENNEKFRLSRGLAPKLVPAKMTKSLSTSEMLADQISREIDERVEYVESMRVLGSLSKSDENRLRGEIKNRIDELNSLKI